MKCCKATIAKLETPSAIASEITGRRRLEKALRKWPEELEVWVQERTVELTRANKSLRDDAEQLSAQTRERLTRFLELSLSEVERVDTDLDSVVRDLVQRVPTPEA